MSTRLRPISDAELLVLKTLWDLGRATVHDVRSALGRRGRTPAYSTVQTFLLRLQAKRYVASEKSARAHVFTPVVTREALLSSQLDDLAERVCDGGSVPLVHSLVQGRRFSPEEIAELRKLVDDLSQPAPPDSTRGRRGSSAS